jgi:hypothetical protein
MKEKKQDEVVWSKIDVKIESKKSKEFIINLLKNSVEAYNISYCAKVKENPKLFGLTEQETSCLMPKTLNLPLPENTLIKIWHGKVLLTEKHLFGIIIKFIPPKGDYVTTPTNYPSNSFWLDFDCKMWRACSNTETSFNDGGKSYRLEEGESKQLVECLIDFCQNEKIKEIKEILVNYLKY